MIAILLSNGVVIGTNQYPELCTEVNHIVIDELPEIFKDWNETNDIHFDGYEFTLADKPPLPPDPITEQQRQINELKVMLGDLILGGI